MTLWSIRYVLPLLNFKPVKKEILVDGEAFDLILNAKLVEWAGLIKPEIARLFDIKQPVFAGTLNFTDLLENRLPERSFEQLPRFPSAPRDIAIVVDEKAKAGDILALIRKIGGALA